ncbi:MAG: glycosyltransferase N-terminal domain-containing protein [Saprospiraceae bacterium]|nr:glycosyltransferase N-terminal domain-containing protein [Saprospiraceae bacterium]
MIFIYDLVLYFYSFFIHVAAFFGNEKARLWCAGRKDIFQKIELALNNKPNNDPNKTPKTIWFHVSSLGEFEQGRPIIEALKDSKFQISDSKSQSSNVKLQIILTFFSPSGYEIRKNYPFVDHVFYLPMDNSHNARRFLNLIKPDLVVFVKYEFWFHYLAQLQKLNIPILLVSAIFREKQFSTLNPYSALLTRILKNFTKIFLQDTPSVNLLKKHHFSNHVLSGDTRVDRVAAIAEEAKPLPIVAEFAQNAPVFVGGSTWEADEKQILPLLKNPKFANWRFIFAPHDISENNVNRLVKLLSEKSIKYSEVNNYIKLNYNSILNYNSELIKNKTKNDVYTEEAVLKVFLGKNKSRILIIDNIGLLSTLYRYGKVAYIGGGFGAGIHNTLEPIAHGLPVLFGAKYGKFVEAVKLVETGGGFVIHAKNEQGTEGVETVMERLLITKNYEKAALAARQYIEQNRGATLQVVDEVEKILCDIEG